MATPHKLPESYKPATWQGTTPAEPDGDVGVVFRRSDIGDKLRLRLDSQSASNLRDTLSPAYFSDLDADTPRPVIVRKAHGEEIVFFSRPMDLPPLELPQPTEPLHIGATFGQPARRGAAPHRPRMFADGKLANWAVGITMVIGFIAALTAAVMGQP